MTDATPKKPSLATRLTGADPRVLTFFEAWNAVRRGRLVPSRHDFDPMAVPALLGCIWLYRLDIGQNDFVCKLAGESVNEAWGASIRGRTLREIVGEADHPVVLRRWHQILSVPLLHYGSASERLSEMDTRRAERLLLPLLGDDGEPDHVLGLSLYTISLVNRERSPLVANDVTQIPCVEL